ncbi:hypothetical protein GGR56DRAFT_675480 [Xylariaceae sp. FL0804]|nr:hypothetical protein GGR56DRAFT_675480 [Xylariaceae sp. FL0804]
MTITRISLFAASDPYKQDLMVSVFGNFVNASPPTNQRIPGSPQDGKPYLISSRAGKCEVIEDKPGSKPWTVIAEMTFASQEDADYYQTEDEVFQNILSQADGEEGFVVVKTDF